MANQNLFGKLDHIGIVVRDIEEAKKVYESLEISDFEKSGIPGKNKTLHGEPLIGGETLMQMGRMGNVSIQVTQPVKPPSMSYEFLENFGEGINHIAYEVEDLREVKEKMINKGFNIIFTSEYIDGGGEIYVDTGHNYCIQFYEGPYKK